MNNEEVNVLLGDCLSELKNISDLLNGLGEGARPTPYIKKYAMIKASGTIEVGFKKLIADAVDKDSGVQIKTFIRKKIRDSSYNPKLGMIENMLGDFDERWKSKFDELISLDDKASLKGSLTCLVDARNDFAHGGDPDLDIEKIVNCFKDGVKVLKILDTVLFHDYTAE